MSRPAELRRGRRLSAAPSRQAETRTSWISQKGTTVSPQRIALEKAYQTDKDELLNMTLSSLVQMNEDPMSKFVERRFDTEDVIAAIERNQSNLHGDGISVDIGELINENPTAILGSIGKELKKDSIKRKMESDMKAFTASRHHSLVENIKKKADASKQRDSNLEVVITNLVNDEKRDKLLDVSMMKEMHMDYLYKKETRLLEQGLGNNKKAQKGALRSQNQNEDLIVSKHIRKNPFSLQLDTGISNKLYYMNIEKKKKKMAFIRMAMEVYKQKNSLLDRRKTNSEVIEYLLSFQKAENNTKNSKEFQCLAMLRRIYIRQSHRDIVANQNKMNKQEFKDVFKKLKLYPDYIALAKIDEIFLETTQGTGKNTIDTLEFLECMRRAAESIYEAIEESDTESSNSQTEDLLLFKLYDRFIHKEMFQFNLPHHEKLNKPTIQQYIFKQDPIIKFLFTSFTKSTDDDVRPFEDPKEPMISFEQIFEMFTLTGLFPHHCEKLQIRFYFDYVAPTEFGLDYEDFKVFIPLIGMDIIDRANKINLHEHLKMKLDPAELQLPKEPLEMLRTFFKSSKYIGSMRVLKQKIMMNENKHRVMDLTAKKTFYNMAKFNKTLLNYMDS